MKISNLNKPIIGRQGAPIKLQIVEGGKLVGVRELVLRDKILQALEAYRAQSQGEAMAAIKAWSALDGSDADEIELSDAAYRALVAAAKAWGAQESAIIWAQMLQLLGLEEE